MVKTGKRGKTKNSLERATILRKLIPLGEEHEENRCYFAVFCCCQERGKICEYCKKKLLMNSTRIHDTNNANNLFSYIHILHAYSYFPSNVHFINFTLFSWKYFCLTLVNFLLYDWILLHPFFSCGKRKLLLMCLMILDFCFFKTEFRL